MKTDFSNRLDSIIKQTLDTDKATKTLLQNAEAQRDKDNAKLLHAFAISQARTNKAIEAVTKLQVTLIQNENRDKILQKMILAMYSAMAADNKVPPVTQDIMNLFKDNNEPDETGDMETETTFGDRANQTK
jgi:NurA-like 5'-3' nuclease